LPTADGALRNIWLQKINLVALANQRSSLLTPLD
jgi:hypothetical protein